MKHLLAILFSFITCFAFAQEADSTYNEDEEDLGSLVIPPINEQMKAGVKMGVGVFMLGGAEANKPAPVLGLVGGAYFRYRFIEHWAVQTELNLTIRGGKFRNKINEYGKIATYNIDVPVFLLHGFDEQNVNNILFGAQYSYVLNRMLYKVDAQTAEVAQPQLNKNDLLLVGGAQFYTPWVGFQLMLKYGLLNANKGLVPSIPPTNQGKMLRNLAFECTFIF